MMLYFSIKCLTAIFIITKGAQANAILENIMNL